MTPEQLDRLVEATLYEGYILYPYRPDAVKNRVRWTFGGVHPRVYSEATGGSDPWVVQTECLLRAPADAHLDAEVRFLHPVRRRLGEPIPPGTDGPGDEIAPGFAEVPLLEVEGTPYRSWEEAVERRLDLGRHRLGDLVGGQPRRLAIAVAPATEVEELRDSAGRVAGVVVRRSEGIDGEVELAAAVVADQVIRVRVTVRNTTPMELRGDGDRDRAMLRALVSTHAVLHVDAGHWVSLADPPADLVEAAARCENRGLWPVLVGEPDEDDTVLASPIILEDHPRVAAESAGDLFDATEIDELLSLRILTLTDAEKREMRAADARARAILERTEALTEEQMLRLHGTIRERRLEREEKG